VNAWNPSGALLVLACLALPAPAAEPAVLPEDTQWSNYNQNVNGQRFVDLAQIDTTNAARLGEVCRIEVEKVGAFHTSLLHLDDTLYFTTATDTVAIDSATCKLRWRHHYVTEDPSGTPLQVNRGLAYANGRLFRGTLDARLLAIDARTGETVWQQQVGDPQQGEFFSASPQIYQGLVILGAAGGDWCNSKRERAFDAASRHEEWRVKSSARND